MYKQLENLLHNVGSVSALLEAQLFVELDDSHKLVYNLHQRYCTDTIVHDGFMMLCTILDNGFGYLEYYDSDGVIIKFTHALAKEKFKISKTYTKPILAEGVSPYYGKELHGDFPPNKIFYARRHAHKVYRRIDQNKTFDIFYEQKVVGLCHGPFDFNGTALQAQLSIYDDDVASLIDTGKIIVGPCYDFRCYDNKGHLFGQPYDVEIDNIEIKHIGLQLK